jgi:cell division protein FtsB
MVANFAKKWNRDFFNTQLLFKVVGIIFIVIIVVLIILDFRIYQKKKGLASQISSYQKQIEDIKKSSQTLKEEITNSDNTDYLEKLAYEQLGQQKPGEKEFIFINPPEKTSPKVAPAESFWSVFTAIISQSWNWLKSKF